MAGIEIVYDGDCPFCSRYVTVARLRDAVGGVKLVDARSDDPIVGEIRGMGLDLNEGMVARYNGRIYHGSDCVHLLSLLSSKSGLLNKFSSLLFSNRRIARLSYPILRAGRNATLRVLGRAPIA